MESIQTIEFNRRRKELQREFQRRIEMLEREQVRRLLATFQEFKARFESAREKAERRQS